MRKRELNNTTVLPKGTILKAGDIPVKLRQKVKVESATEIKTEVRNGEIYSENDIR